MNIELEWCYKGNEFRGFIPNPGENIYTAVYKSSSTQWGCHIKFVSRTGEWKTHVLRRRTKRGQFDLYIGLDLDHFDDFDGKWELGPFGTLEEAKKGAEAYLAMRVNPTTWRNNDPLIAYENSGHLSYQEVTALPTFK